MSIRTGMIFISGNYGEYIFVALENPRLEHSRYFNTFTQRVKSVKEDINNENNTATYNLRFSTGSNERGGGWKQTLLKTNRNINTWS